MRKSFILLAFFAVLAIIVTTEARIDSKLLASIVGGKRCGSSLRFFNGLFPNTTSPLIAQVIHGPRLSQAVTRTDNPFNYGASSDYLKLYPGPVTVRVSFVNRTEVIKFSFKPKDNTAYVAAIVNYPGAIPYEAGNPVVTVSPSPFTWMGQVARVSVVQEEINPPQAGKFGLTFHHNSRYNLFNVDMTLTKRTFRTTLLNFDQAHAAAGSPLPGDYNYISRPASPSSIVAVTQTNNGSQIIPPVTLTGLGLNNLNYAVHFYGNPPGLRAINPSTVSFAGFFSAIDRYGCVHSALANGATLPITLAPFAFQDRTTGQNLTSLPNSS